MRRWIGSFLFTVYLFLSVATYGFVVLLCRPFGYRAAYAAVRIWVDATLWMLAVLCDLRYEVRGLENLPAQNGVIFMKHSSAWETIAQIKIFPKQTWVMKRELLWAPVLGWVIFALKPIAIDRGGGRAAVDQVVSRGRARLEEGFWVVIFPEGTRVPAGQTKRYGISGTLLAKHARQAIVPVAHNAGAFWPRRGWLKRPGTITVEIGSPIEVGDREPREVNAEIQAWIEARLRRMQR
jgi:1-acyl-sn-glycerol-3-phosphate acyltransferase